MPTEHHRRPWQEAFDWLYEEQWEMLSAAAQTLLDEAEEAADTYALIHNVSHNPEDYDEVMEKMRIAATEITGRDRELLAKLWRAALAVAASIDPDDETPAPDITSWRDVHWYYRSISGMIEEILREKKFAELREEVAKREPEYPNDILF